MSKLAKQVEQVWKLMRKTAEREILPRFNKVQSVVKEQHGTFKETVTEADIASSKYILDRIRREVPGSYSEEHRFEDRFAVKRLWQFDPVDGTDEFCAGMADGYAMHAAYLEAHQNRFVPRAGIIYCPGTGITWMHDGSRVRRFEGKHETTLPAMPRTVVLGYVRKTDLNDHVSEAYHALAAALDIPCGVVPSGGAGASFVSLMEGGLSVIIMNYDYTKEWDVAMAEPLIRSRGGFLCDFDGNDFTYNRKDPFNRRGYVASFVLPKKTVMPFVHDSLLIRRLS